MTKPLHVLRLAAILLPAALLLHELAYLIGGGGMIAAHHYLQVLIPAAVASGVSLALAALVLPTLGSTREGSPQLHAPFVLAAAMLAIFTAQEAAEAAFLGGGLEGLAASAAVAWLAPPLALLLGALTSALLAFLDHTGALLAEPRSPGGGGETPTASPVPSEPVLATLACACLAFGFARRPPPVLAVAPGF